MAKKNKSLLKFKQPTAPKISQFNKFANKIYHAKQRKAQKMHETKQRVMSRIGAKGRIPKTKKINKYALIDGQIDATNVRMKHKGKNINDIKNFNDVEFGVQQQLPQIENQQNIQFSGFEDHKKSKNQVYKEIIEKSKLYKYQRQQQYQKNYNIAIQLDQNINQLLPSLKFISAQKKVKQKINNKDLQYDRLVKQLEQDQRIVPQKNIQKIKKQTQKHKSKKAQQLKNLLKQQDQDQDIRGWIDQQQQNQQDQQEQQDQIDDVQLSSEEEDNENQEDEISGQNQDDEEKDNQDQSNDFQEAQDDNQLQSQQEQLEENLSQNQLSQGSQSNSNQVKDNKKSPSKQQSSEIYINIKKKSATKLQKHKPLKKFKK